MKRILYLLPIVLMVNNALAWGPDGHKIVAQIAQDKLNPNALKAVSKLIPGQDLASVANWADAIKSKPEWVHTKSWHFVDIADEGDYETAEHAPDGDIIGAITDMVKVLKTPSATELEKQNALKFIVHFVGDIHQPLHVGRPDDHGGNSIKVMFMGKSMNLHSLWDSGMISKQNMDYVQYARFLQGQSTFTAPYDLPEISFSQIIEEDMSSRKEIYNFRPISEGPIKLEDGYLKRNLSTMNDRLLKGGERLSTMLNQIFK
jgi:hypothetical protein